MSTSILESVKSRFTDELIGKASSYLGESQTGINKAIEGILPALLISFTRKGLTNAGSTQMLNTIRDQQLSVTLENAGNYFENDGGSILNKGSKLFSGLLGEKGNEMIALISNFSGISKSSAATLLSVASPLILGALGNEVLQNNLDSKGLTGLLSSQKNNFISALPSGLNFASDIETHHSESDHYSKEINIVMDNTEDKSAMGLRILLPLLLLALTAGGFLYFFKGGKNEKLKNSITNKELPAIMNNSGSTTTDASGTIDADDNFVYNVGDTITINLPNKAGELKVGKYSTEAKLCTFLQDGNSSIDSIMGNWFEFTNVRFKTGGSIIENSSLDQLKNMVTITKGFPKAQFKIGGYTDSTGNANTNITLSQKRADAVLAMLIKLGASSKSIIGAKGYGPQHPLESNITPEGRAKNRRVAVNVKAK